MFEKRRQATFGNINLGRMPGPPAVSDLQGQLESGMKYRGRFVELSWIVPKTGVHFVLTAKVSTGGDPAWMLYAGHGSGSQLIWGQYCKDLNLLNNLVLLECEKSGAELGVGPAPEPEPQKQPASEPSAAPSPQPAAAPAPSNPALTWLQNAQSSLAADTAAKAVVSPVEPDEPALPAAAAEPVQATPEMSGSLANISVANVLKHAATTDFSGRLSLQGAGGGAEVFFVSGAVVHAATLDAKGEQALFDLLTWREGEFNFAAGERTNQKTVDRNIKALIEFGVWLAAHSDYLQERKLRQGSYLVRTASGGGVCGKEELYQKVTAVIGGDVEDHERFYQAADGNCTLADILRKRPLVRTEWVPLVSQLLRSGLLSVQQGPLSAERGMLLEPVAIESAQIDKALALWAHPSDSIMIYEAFLFLLQQEFYRFERTGSRVALVIFTLARRDPLSGNLEALPPATVAAAGARILALKRKLDMLGHLDTEELSVILPETDNAGALVFAHRVAQLLSKPALSPELEGGHLALFAGVASIPDDVQDPGTLIASARIARTRAKMTGVTALLYADTLS